MESSDLKKKNESFSKFINISLLRFVKVGIGEAEDRNIFVSVGKMENINKSCAASHLTQPYGRRFCVGDG